MATKYVDNTLIALGTVSSVSGTDVNFSSLVFQTGFAVADLVNCGVRRIAGGSFVDGEFKTYYKATATAGDHSASKVKLTASAPAGWVSGSTIEIVYGADNNLNSGTSPNKQSGFAGPYASVQYAYDNSANADIVYVNSSNRPYTFDENRDAGYGGVCNFWQSNRGILFRGYYDRASVDSLYQAGITSASQLNTALYPHWRPAALLTFAPFILNTLGAVVDGGTLSFRNIKLTADIGSQVVSQLTGRDLFQDLRGAVETASTLELLFDQCIVGDGISDSRLIGSGVVTGISGGNIVQIAGGITFESGFTSSYLPYAAITVTSASPDYAGVYRTGSSSGHSNTQFTVDTTAPSWWVGKTVSMYLRRQQRAYHQNLTHGTGKAYQKKTRFVNCQINSSYNAVYARALNELVVTGCVIREMCPAGVNNSSAIEINVDTTSENHQVRFIDISNNDVELTINPLQNNNSRLVFFYDVLKSTVPSIGGGSFNRHLRINNNRLYNYAQGAPIEILGPLKSLEIRNNRITGGSLHWDGVHSSSGSGVLINLGPDAAPTIYPSRVEKRILASGIVGASGNSTTTINISNGIDPLTAAAVSADNNAYLYRGVTWYKASSPVVKETRRVASYNGSTKVITIASGSNNPNFSGTPASGDLFEVFEEVFANIVIENNDCDFTYKDSTFNIGLHCLLIGQGWDGAYVANNVFRGGDNGLVIKGEYGTYFGNKVWCGGGACLIKGGSYNIVRGNIFVTGRGDPAAFGGAGCFDIMDRSANSDGLQWVNASKSVGNVVVENIFAVIGCTATAFLDEAALGYQGWATNPIAYSVLQHNFFDRNLYWRDSNGDGVSDTLNNSNPMAVLGTILLPTLSDLRSYWSATATWSGSYMAMSFPDNDKNSQYGNPMLVDPRNGDFRVYAGSPALTMGITGGPIGGLGSGQAAGSLPMTDGLILSERTFATTQR